jgi:LmbE family N-acetylglucosaminyl deacetylase
VTASVLPRNEDDHGPSAAALDERWRRSIAAHRLPRLALPTGRVLVVAPHPDDEVFGIGGTLALAAAAGAEVAILAVSDGEASHARSDAVTSSELRVRRADERREALRRLGLGSARVDRLGLPDGELRTVGGLMAAAIAERLDESTTCFATWRHDGHPDHDAVGQAAVAAARRTGARLIEYPVWAWDRCPTGAFPWARAHRVPLGSEIEAAKRAAAGAFVSQLEPLGPEPEDGPVVRPESLVQMLRPVEVVLC